MNVDLTCTSANPPPPAGCTSFGAITGSAGTTGQPIYVGVFAQGNSLIGGLTGAVAGVSVRLVNFQTGASVQCATGAGADPGSTLTDSTGYAICNPILSGAGSGQYSVVVGGTVFDSVNYTPFPQDYTNATPAKPPYASIPFNGDSSQPQPSFQGYIVTGVINETITPAQVGGIQFSGGNNQTGTSGQALAFPLIATVVSTAGTPLANQAVTWGPVSPSGAAILTNTVATSGADGRVSTNVTLASNASGTVSIPVSTGGKTATFTVVAILPTTLTSLTKVSGDRQTALVNAAFANPLVVQVAVSSGSVANQTVTFSVSGPATLSSSSVTTDGNGRAQVTVQAGTTAGAVTVTAGVGNLTPVTFTLTVSPPGPQLTPSSFVNGADFQKGSISPCSIATILAAGLAPTLNGAISSNNLGVGPLGYTVATDTVTVAGAQAPIYNVANINSQQQLTFQVPCTVQPGSSVPVTVTVGSGSATVNVAVQPASPGVFQTSSSINVLNFGQLPIATVLKLDGTLVSPTNPARLGETVIAYVTGLGPTSPSVGTNALPIFGGVPSNVTGQVIVGIQNAGVPVSFARLSEDLIGVYLVGFQIPTGTPAGNDVFSIGIVPAGSQTPYYSNPAAIYIQ